MDPQNLKTVNDVFSLILQRDHPRTIIHKRDGEWQPISARELYRSVAALARAMTAWGLRKGDRVGLLSENRAEWAMVDFACLGLGLVDVPIYSTLTAEQTAFILNDAGARVLFVSTRAQLDKVLSVRSHTKLEKIVVMDDLTSPDVRLKVPHICEADVGVSLNVIYFAELVTGAPLKPSVGLSGEFRSEESGSDDFRDSHFDAQLQTIEPGDLATIIYTSGTTGTPKGAMLTHSNLASNLVHSLEVFGLTDDDVAISCLPLAHITARHTDYAMFQYGVPVAYCPDINQLSQVLQEVRPTFFVGVPRLYEKVRSQVEQAANGGLRRLMFEFAMNVGRQHSAEVLAGGKPTSRNWQIADRLVFSKIAAGFGGRARIFISGGAPLGRDLAEWYAAVGIRIFEGYGLTETSPVIALNFPGAHKLGTVGKPLPNVECRLAPDGELLVRGPSVFHGYWNRPEETQAAFDADWFRTGDVASLDDEGFLSITDRKKDLIKTSGGKFIAPQPIENALKNNPLVAQAAVIGDRRKFASVILAPQFPMLEDWARANSVPFTTRAELVADPRVQALYEGIVADLNRELAQFETLKRVLVVPDEFTIATGELTPTLKLKRRVVEQKYRDQIEALYDEAERIPQAAAR